MASDADGSFDSFDFVDFAQEFLRRNTDYQAQFFRLCKGQDPDLESPAFRKMAQSWGLEFRYFALCYCSLSTGNLAIVSRTFSNCISGQARSFGCN